MTDNNQTTAQAHSLSKRKLSLSLLIVLLLLLSWSGSIDDYSTQYTDRSIFQAGAVFGISRALNAAISVAQTSTIEVGIAIHGSITIGEVLDPLNDLVERFSEVMTISLSSLVLQKILLGVASHDVFKWLCTLSGLLVLLLLWFKNNHWLNLATNTFLILILTRLSLAIVLSLNHLADHFFLKEEIETNQQQIESLQTDIDALNEKKQLAALIQQSELYQQQLANDQSLLDKTRIQFTQQEKILNQKISTLSLSEKLQCLIHVSYCPEDIKLSKQQTDQQRINLEQLEKRIKQNQYENQTLSSEIAQLQSGDVPWYKQIKNIDMDVNFTALKNKITDGISNMIYLLVLFLLKTILIPVFFYYLLLKSLKFIWKMDWHQLTVSAKGMKE